MDGWTEGMRDRLTCKQGTGMIHRGRPEEEIHVWRHGENEAPILSTCIAAKVLEGGCDSVHQLRYSTLTRILVKI